MRPMLNDKWRRSGSSIVFDRDCLAPLIANDHMVSLRTALGWMAKWPAMPPGQKQTVLVAGLETMLQVMEPREAEHFLRHVAKPFILQFQDRWPEAGLVFGFAGNEKHFVVTNDASEEILYKVRSNQTIRLSFTLWDGTSTLDIRHIVHQTRRTTTTHGYHVSRIS